MTDDDSATGLDGDRSDDRRVAVSRRDVLKTTGAGLAATGISASTVGSASADEGAVDTPWLEVEGNEVLDPAGNEVILRGVNIPDPKRLDTTVAARGKNWNHLIDHATDAEQGWYANVVRIPVQPGDVAEKPPIPMADVEYWEPGVFTQSQLETYCEEYLDPVVEYCRQRGVYCIVDYHRHWGKLRWTRDDLDEEVRMFWHTVAPRYAGQPHVLFEVYNEPTLPGMYIDDWYTAKYAGIWRRWKKTAQPWVDVIREYAPENLIIVGSPGWSSQPEGAQIEEFDGGNLLYTYHIYPGHGITSAEGFDSRDAEQYGEEGTASVWEQVPLFMTEFGWEPGAGRWIGGETSGFGEGVSQWADDRPIHWTAWCFDTAWLPSMFDRAFVEEGADDAVGNPYEGSIPELCSDPPCEWALLGRDEGNSEYMGEYVRAFLERRRNDDVPQIAHDPSPPPAPSGLSASPATNSAELSWNGVTDDGSGLAQYVVTVDGEAWLETESTAATVPDLLAGQTHQIGVVAVDEYGNRSDPATTAVTTESAATPGTPNPPANLTLADRTHRSVTLSWAAPADTAVGRYVVTVDGETVARLRPDETTYRLDGLALDVAHQVEVQTVDRAGTASEPRSAAVSPRPAHATGDDVLINDFEGSEPLTTNALDAWVGGGLADGVEGGIAQFSWDGITYHGTTAEVDGTETPSLKIKARGEEGYELSMLALRVGDRKVPVGDLTDDRIDTDWSVVTIDLSETDLSLTPVGQLQFDAVWGTAGAFEVDRIWLAGEDDPADGIDVGAEVPTTPDDSTPTETPDTPTLTETPDTPTPDQPIGTDDPGQIPEDEMDVEPVVGDRMPHDMDADRQAEDVDGDGELDFNDLVAYYQHKDDPAMTDHVGAYDYTDDGDLDFNDLVALYQEMQG